MFSGWGIGAIRATMVSPTPQVPGVGRNRGERPSGEFRYSIGHELYPVE
jgi:hypothetical protein